MLRYALRILDLTLEAATRGDLSNIAIFTVIAIFDLLLKRQLLLIVKIKLRYKYFDSTLKSKRFTSQPSLQAFNKLYFRHEFLLPTAEFRRFFWHSRISLICLIHLSLPKLYFYTIRSKTKFLKVLNKKKFKVLTRTLIIPY